nr:hypothetical protein [uncultured Flavobacterium sp.]
MSNLIKYPIREHATFCYKNNCVTVYGGTAQFVNAIAVTVLAVSAIALIAKAFK